jgi:hypothetical protein
VRRRVFLIVLVVVVVLGMLVRKAIEHEDDDKHEDEHDFKGRELQKHPKKKALYIQADQPTVEGLMRERQRIGILVLCAVAGMFFLASCVGNPPTPTPATHKMVGTNSPGY